MLVHNNERKDVDRVGLSESSRLKLDELVHDGIFKDNLSCYRFAVSLALYADLDISSHEVNRPQGHMYLISQVDPENIFKKVIVELLPDYADQPYRALEKLADLGLSDVQKRYHENGLILP